MPRALKLVPEIRREALVDTPHVVQTLLSIAKLTRAMMGLRLAELGLFNGQDQLLMLLQAGKPMAVNDVAASSHIRASTVSKMTDRLVAKGFMERTKDSGDARRTGLLLTADGIAMQVQVLELWKKLGEELAISFGPNSGVIEGQLQSVEEVLTSKLRRLR